MMLLDNTFQEEIDIGRPNALQSNCNIEKFDWLVGFYRTMNLVTNLSFRSKFSHSKESGYYH